MKKKIHYTLYAIFLGISVLLIGLYFIKTSNAWCILSCSVGASLIGAVALGLCIEWRSETNRVNQNKQTFRVTNSNIYLKIYSLLMVVYLAIKELNKILKFETDFKYEDKSIAELLDIYAEAIQKIKENTAPMIANNGVASAESIEYMRNRDKAIKILKKYDKSLQEYRKKFDDLKEKFEINKNILLVSDVCSEKTIFMLSAVLSVLGTQKNNKFTKEEELIEYGNSFEELKTCQLISVLDTIGFDRITFNNKKEYFDSELIKGKKK